MKTQFCVETKGSMSLADKEVPIELRKDWLKSFIPREESASSKPYLFDICLEQLLRTTSSLTVPYVVSCLCNIIKNYECVSKRDDRAKLLKLIISKLPCSLLSVFEYLSDISFRVGAYENMNDLNSNDLGIIFGATRKDVSLEMIKNISHLVADHHSVFKEKCSLINEYGLFASRETIKPFFKVNRQVYPKPSTVMPGIYLKPLRVMIPDSDAILDNFDNTTDNAPILLMESSDHAYLNEVQVSSKLINEFGLYVPAIRKRRSKRSLKKCKDQTEKFPFHCIIYTDILFKDKIHEKIIRNPEKPDSLTTATRELESISDINREFVLPNIPPVPKNCDVSLDFSVSKHNNRNDNDEELSAKDQKNSSDCDITVSPIVPSSLDCLVPEDKTKKRDSISWSTLISSEEPVRSDHFSWPLLKGCVEEEPLRYDFEHCEPEAPLSPSAYRSYHSYQISADRDINLPPSPPFEQEHFKLSAIEDSSSEMKQMLKKIHVLKKKLLRFDEKYESENGYKPSHAEKAKFPEAKKFLNDLHKAKKELQALKETSRIIHQSCTLSNDWSKREDAPVLENLNNYKNDTAVDSIVPKFSVRRCFGESLKILNENRKAANRPESIEQMTDDQVRDEKLAIQKVLLRFESIHGKPSKASADRNTVRPLYDRYRNVKRLLVRSSSFPICSSKGSSYPGLQPIMEHEAMNFSSLPDVFMPESFPIESSSYDDTEETVEINCLNGDNLTSCENDEYTYSNIHELPLPEMILQQQQAHSQKNQLRKTLREFETEFLRINGRKVQKPDKAPMESIYAEYKWVKAQIRLLEALISKQCEHSMI